MPILQDITELQAMFRATRNRTTSLCCDLTPEDMCIQADDDASPTKWHLAHTTWFFDQFLLRAFQEAYEPYCDSFDYLFNSYYDSVGAFAAKPTRGLISRPSVQDVMAYREAIDDAVIQLLDRDDLDQPVRETVQVGINHEQQHQELLLMDIKHLFARNPLRPAYCKEQYLCPAFHFLTNHDQWHRIDGGIRTIGAEEAAFAYDNEKPSHDVIIRDFELRTTLVTCGEYLEFIEAGGYQNAAYWLSDGWKAVKAHEWQCPMYWTHTDGGWEVMTLHGQRPLREEEPVCHVSYFEADAFARFRGCRLPTEQEWEVGSEGAGLTGNFLEQGSMHPAPSGLCMDHSPTAAEPVASSDNGRIRFGDRHFPRVASSQVPPAPLQLFGDLWEWTSSPYQAYPGFRSYDGSLREYNAKFMCNQFVLRGGCCVTPIDHLRRTYRNFYAPVSRWLFSGIRLARDVASSA
ncbi:MAG: ergothioneine biosynthesis protein EgtB [Phycisphaerae bacterium]